MHQLYFEKAVGTVQYARTKAIDSVEIQSLVLDLIETVNIQKSLILLGKTLGFIQ